MKLNGLILAAGLSSRMGDFKPLMPIGGRALIELSIESLFNGGAKTVTVVLGHRAEDISARLSRRFSPDQVRYAVNPAYAETDMLASIKIGLSAVPACDAFFLLPGDMPAVHKNTMDALSLALGRSDARVAIPLIGERRKHPPLIRYTCIGDIQSYVGEDGLRGLWRTYEGKIEEVAVSDRGCLMDADRMDDFIAISHYLTLQCMI